LATISPVWSASFQVGIIRVDLAEISADTAGLLIQLVQIVFVPVDGF
jgi:hypothetical protein